MVHLEARLRSWMKSMIRWSHNKAAGDSAARAIGYPYINGALLAAGFFGGTPPQGLWLSGDYQGNDWIRNRPGEPQNRAGQPLTERWAKAQSTEGESRIRSNMTATAAQVCRLLTLVAQGTLVDSNSSGEMMRLMDRRCLGAVGEALCGPLSDRPQCGEKDFQRGHGSYVAEALAHGRTLDGLFSKIGYGDNFRSHDCAIVERTLPSGSKIRYVVVGLGSKSRTERNYGACSWRSTI